MDDPQGSVWVKFDADYDHPVGPRSIIAYKRWMRLRVPRAHADAAIAAGKAHEVEAPATREEAKAPDEHLA